MSRATSKSQDPSSGHKKEKGLAFDKFAQPDLANSLEEGVVQQVTRQRRSRRSTIMQYSLLLLASCFLTFLATANANPASPWLRERAEATAQGAASASYIASYTAPSGFPTSAFKSYYEQPTGTLMEPRPAITNGVQGGEGGYFSDTVANPSFLQTGAASSEAVYPKASARPKPPSGLSSSQYSAQAQGNISAIISANASSTCDMCLQSLAIGQKLARAYPQEGPQAMIDLCKKYKGTTKLANQTCERQYAPAAYGAAYTQILSYADVTSPNSTDGRYICGIILSSYCPVPSARYLSPDYLKSWFGSAGVTTPKSVIERGLKEQAQLAKNPSKELVRVAHLSDIHVDPRYLIGSEAACTNGQCCRADSYNSTLVKTPPNATFTPDGNVQLTLTADQIVEPAVYWGRYKCDSVSGPLSEAQKT
jgi:sphingomyelin phosphodiesterase